MKLGWSPQGKPKPVNKQSDITVSFGWADTIVLLRIPGVGSPVLAPDLITRGIAYQMVSEAGIVEPVHSLSGSWILNQT